MPRFFEIPDVGRFDFDHLVSFLPGQRRMWRFFANRTQGRYIRAMLASEDVLRANGIDSALRLAHFIGQGLIETGWLRYHTENLNYSEEALKATFSFYRRNPDLARQHARKPEVIANTVYQNHPSLGNREPGDGWRFRGRGFIQLTGRDNYERYAEASKVDVVQKPDILSQDLKKSIEVAAAFWRVNGLSAFADADDAAKVSRGVNRGDPHASAAAHGEGERIAWTAIALGVVRSPQAFTQDAAAPEPPVSTVLKQGAFGEDVRALQEKLAALGYEIGVADGAFGPATHRAVLAAQHDLGLAQDGIAGPATLEAIDAEVDDAVRASREARRREGPSAFDFPPPLASELAGARDPFMSHWKP
ncbi:MAG: peptidoglycan-binding protein [Pseudomonadota bacterium]